MLSDDDLFGLDPELIDELRRAEKEANDNILFSYIIILLLLFVFLLLVKLGITL